jgi:hypothetical protein
MICKVKEFSGVRISKIYTPLSIRSVAVKKVRSLFNKAATVQDLTFQHINILTIVQT